MMFQGQYYKMSSEDTTHDKAFLEEKMNIKPISPGKATMGNLRSQIHTHIRRRRSRKKAEISLEDSTLGPLHVGDGDEVRRSEHTNFEQ